MHAQQNSLSKHTTLLFSNRLTCESILLLASKVLALLDVAETILSIDEGETAEASAQFESFVCLPLPRPPTTPPSYILPACESSLGAILQATTTACVGSL